MRASLVCFVVVLSTISSVLGFHEHQCDTTLRPSAPTMLELSRPGVWGWEYSDGGFAVQCHNSSHHDHHYRELHHEHHNELPAGVVVSVNVPVIHVGQNSIPFRTLRQGAEVAPIVTRSSTEPHPLPCPEGCFFHTRSHDHRHPLYRCMPEPDHYMDERGGVLTCPCIDVCRVFKPENGDPFAYCEVPNNDMCAALKWARVSDRERRHHLVKCKANYHMDPIDGFCKPEPLICPPNSRLVEDEHYNRYCYCNRGYIAHGSGKSLRCERDGCYDECQDVFCNHHASCRGDCGCTCKEGAEPVGNSGYECEPTNCTRTDCTRSTDVCLPSKHVGCHSIPPPSIVPSTTSIQAKCFDHLIVPPFKVFDHSDNTLGVNVDFAIPRDISTEFHKKGQFRVDVTASYASKHPGESKVGLNVNVVGEQMCGWPDVEKQRHGIQICNVSQYCVENHAYCNVDCPCVCENCICRIPPVTYLIDSDWKELECTLCDAIVDPTEQIKPNCSLCRAKYPYDDEQYFDCMKRHLDLTKSKRNGTIYLLDNEIYHPADWVTKFIETNSIYSVAQLEKVYKRKRTEHPQRFGYGAFFEFQEKLELSPDFGHRFEIGGKKYLYIPGQQFELQDYKIIGVNPQCTVFDIEKEYSVCIPRRHGTCDRQTTKRRGKLYFEDLLEEVRGLNEQMKILVGILFALLLVLLAIVLRFSSRLSSSRNGFLQRYGRIFRN